MHGAKSLKFINVFLISGFDFGVFSVCTLLSPCELTIAEEECSTNIQNTKCQVWEPIGTILPTVLGIKYE